MLKIRLRRTGAKKQPRYRVVVAESSAPRDGAFVEIIGWYNPQADPAQVVVNTEKAREWLARGAQPSDRVAYLLKQAGLGETAATEAAVAAEATASNEGATEPSRRGRATRKSAVDVPPSEAPESEGSAGLSEA